MYYQGIPVARFHVRNCYHYWGGMVMIVLLFLLVELNVRHVTKTEQNKTMELESRGMI